MNDRECVLAAQTLALDAHADQTDKVGKPYFGHVQRVATAVREDGFGKKAQAVAYLHDVVEDTATTLADLERIGFPADVVTAVDAITKRPHEPFRDYYERVKANPLAIAVKWHDVADNAREDRLALVAPDTRERLRLKYERAKAELQGARRS